MASIEDRSRFVVTVQKREDLTKTFAYTRERELNSYIADLKDAGYKPNLVHTDDSFAVRVRQAGHRKQCLYASTLRDAIDIQARVSPPSRGAVRAAGRARGPDAKPASNPKPLTAPKTRRGCKLPTGSGPGRARYRL